MRGQFETRPSFYAGTESQRHPRPVMCRTRYAPRDEVHTVHAVADVRVKGVAIVPRLPGRAANDVVEGGEVDVGKRLEETFRVTGRRVARDHPVRLAIDAVEHLVRFFLAPLQRSLRAIDLQPEIVLAPVRD